MSGPGAVGVHAHVVPEGFLRTIESEGEAHGARLRAGPEGPAVYGADAERAVCERGSRDAHPAARPGLG